MRTLTNDRGSILVFVGLSMAILFGIAALVVDHGYNLTEYRQLTTGTDAAALAAADAYAFGTTGCDAVAADFLARNTPDANLLSCTATGDTTNGTFGWVVVEAEVPVQQLFAGVIGRDIVVVTSRSVAVFGAPLLEYSGGLRPMALCLEGLRTNPAFQDWEVGGGDVESDPIRVLYNKEQPADCGSTTGNWGFVDFDGGSGSNQETIDWIENGYNGQVQPGWYESRTGAISGSHRSALNALESSGETFWLPLMTEANGNGANARFYLSSFIAVRLTDSRVTGSQKSRYIEFVIDPQGLVPEVSCCTAPDGDDSGLRTTGLFALDADGAPIGVDND